jgi:hypothetical protein
MGSIPLEMRHSGRVPGSENPFGVRRPDSAASLVTIFFLSTLLLEADTK